MIAVQGRSPLLLSAYTARGTLQHSIACRRRRNPFLPSTQRRQHGVWRAQLHGAACAASSSLAAGSAAQQRHLVRPRACPQARPGPDAHNTRNSPTAQAVPPGHPSFRRQRASRACESKSAPSACSLLCLEKHGRESCGRIASLDCLGTSVWPW